MVCSHKHLLFDLVSPVNVGLVASVDEAWEIAENARRIQSHSCEKGNLRCHKKTDNEGRGIFPFALQRQSNEYGHDEVMLCHSEECVNLVVALGCASRREGVRNDFDFVKELKG